MFYVLYRRVYNKFGLILLLLFFPFIDKDVCEKMENGKAREKNIGTMVFIHGTRIDFPSFVMWSNRNRSIVLNSNMQYAKANNDIALSYTIFSLAFVLSFIQIQCIECEQLSLESCTNENQATKINKLPHFIKWNEIIHKRIQKQRKNNFCSLYTMRRINKISFNGKSFSFLSSYFFFHPCVYHTKYILCAVCFFFFLLSFFLSFIFRIIFVFIFVHMKIACAYNMNGACSIFHFHYGFSV